MGATTVSHDSAVNYEPEASTLPVPSRNALKRKLKEEKFAAAKAERKALQKERDKAKKQRKREQYQQQTLDGSEVATEDPLRKKIKPEEQTPSTLRIAIDADFEGSDEKGNPFMSEKEFLSCARQIGRCYAENRRAKIPVVLSVCGLGDKMKTALTKFQPEWNRWKLEMNSANVVDAFTSTVAAVDSEIITTDEKIAEEKTLNEITLVNASKTKKNDIVYLTADSKTILTDLDESKVYVIGGIVDRNRYKGLCLDRANEMGIFTAQLPIGEYIQMASRKVLTVNQVMEIMIKYLETRDWKAAFLDVIPQRKIEPKIRHKNAKKQIITEGGETGIGSDDADEEQHEQIEEAKRDTNEKEETRN